MSFVDGRAGLVEDLRQLAARLGWQYSTSTDRPDGGPPADPDAEVLVALRREAQRQQDEAVRLSRRAQMRPQDLAARDQASRAWRRSEARWRAVGAVEHLAPRSRTQGR